MYRSETYMGQTLLRLKQLKTKTKPKNINVTLIFFSNEVNALDDNPSKTMKKGFLFHLKSSFRS